MRHNKKRNSALLYEFLIRHISKSLIEDRKDEANKTVAILKRYFAKGSALHEELNLFNQVFKTRANSLLFANGILREIVSRSSKIDQRRLMEEKSNLIQEIHQRLSSVGFYEHKIPNYIIFASLQMLFNERKMDKIERLKIEERVAQFITEDRKNGSNVADAMHLDPKYSNAVARIIQKKFDEKYANTLNESQQKLLRKYAISLVSKKKEIFEGAARKAIEAVKMKLSVIRDDEILADRELVANISECRTKLASLPASDLSEQHLISLLQFMALAEEVAP